MSIQAMAWALKQQEIKDPAQRHVLLCLANYSGEGGQSAFPSIGQLMRDTGMSESTVRRSLQDLEVTGIIGRGNQAIAAAHIERADRRPVVYDIRGVTVKPREGNGVSPEASRGVKNGSTGCQALTPDPKRSEENLKSKHPNGLKSLSQILQNRENPPSGRSANFDSEFERRFGCKPT